MARLWILCFSLFFKAQFCISTYLFTQESGKTSVCKLSPPDNGCIEGDIFVESAGKNLPMTLGFLNAQSDKFHDDYNMAEYGFPIFYEYFFNAEEFRITFIIANGKKIDEKGQYYYVQLLLENGECNNTRPTTPENKLSGALYMNQKYAKYAYYIYQSSSSTCILSIKFEDLLRGSYGTTLLPLAVIAHEVHEIKREVPNYVHPFFTIDPIFGTMVYLIKNGTKNMAVVHYKIDENDLTNFEEVFSYPLSFGSQYKTVSNSLVFQFSGLNTETTHFDQSRFPSFTSYGKSINLFFIKDFTGVSNSEGLSGFWSPMKPPGDNMPGLPTTDLRRHLYYLNPEYIEKGEPVGQLIPTATSLHYPSSATTVESNSINASFSTLPTPPSIPIPAPLKTVPESECSEESSNFLVLYLVFAVIDFILMLGLLGLIFLVWFGTKKMKKLRHRRRRAGKKAKKQQKSMYGQTTGATCAAATTVNGNQPSQAAAGGATPSAISNTVGNTTQLRTWK